MREERGLRQCSCRGAVRTPRFAAVSTASWMSAVLVAVFLYFKYVRKDPFLAGETLFGCWADLGSPLAAELVGRFRHERRAFRADALTVNTSILTAISNDYSFDRVYARQLEAVGRPGDVAVGLSTSGKAASVILAFEKARELGMTTVAMTGSAASPASVTSAAAAWAAARSATWM